MIADAIILRRGDIGIQIAQAFAVVTRDDTGDDNVAAAVRGEMIGAVGLEPFAQRLGHGIAQPRLQRLVVERAALQWIFHPAIAPLTGPR